MGLPTHTEHPVRWRQAPPFKCHVRDSREASLLTFSSPRLPAPLPPSVSEALSSVFYDRFVASSPGQGGASAGDRPAGLPLSEAGPVCPLLTEALALGAVRAGARGTRCAVAPEPTEAVGTGRLSPPERCHRGRREADARKPGPRSRVQAGFKGRGARVGVRAEGLGPGARSWLCPALGSGGSRGPTFPSGPPSAWPVVLARFLRLATRPLVGQDGAF